MNEFYCFLEFTQSLKEFYKDTEKGVDIFQINYRINNRKQNSSLVR